MSTQAKHTPGPWHIGMKPGPMVYGPQGEQVVGINVMLDIEEVTANAHLIAAAPAMYEALKECLASLEVAQQFEGDVFGIHHNDTMDAMSKAETALAQAEVK